MVAATGVEPVSLGWEPSVLTTWLSRHYTQNSTRLVSTERIELSFLASKTSVLPLDEVELNIVGRQGRTRTFKTFKGNGVTARDATSYALPAD